MKKFPGAAPVAIAAAILAIGLPQAALAQKKGEKAPSVKLSKPVQSLLAQAQPLLVSAQGKQASDPAGAVADAKAALPFIEQADALPEKTGDDAIIISQLRLNAGILSKDNAQIEKALQAGLATGKLSAEDQTKYLRNLGALALQRNDVNAAVGYFEQLMKAAPNDPQLMVEVAELQRRQGLNQKAIATLMTAIGQQEKTAGKADESWYRRALAIAYDSKLAAETTLTSEALVRAYPNPTNWRDVLIIFRETGKWDDQANLDILRLLRANNALAGERDFAEYADTATIRGLPGEAKAVVDEGIAKGALQASKPLVKELLAAVSPKVAADKASLPGLEKESMASKTGKLAQGTGDAYLGYGNYAKAAEMYRAALQKGGVDAGTVNTRLGLALGKAGDKAGAEAALKSVTGAPREQLARYYLIWLGQQS